MDNIPGFNPAKEQNAACDLLGKCFEADRTVDKRSEKTTRLAASGKQWPAPAVGKTTLPCGELIDTASKPMLNPVPPVAMIERRKPQADLERAHRELQKIVAALDSLREEEQRRLAHDMHDDLGQLLAAMKIELDALRQRVSAQADEPLQAINNLGELVDTMALSVRRIIADLPPKALEDFGLFCAIEMLTENFQKRHHIFVHLKKPSPEPLMRCNLKTPVYRMIQEALNNIAKHARATQVDVQIEYGNACLDLAIRDNGTGLAPDSLHKPDSFGLLGMQQRTAALGGKFSISNIPGSGTEIRILIPLRPRGIDAGNGAARL